MKRRLLNLLTALSLLLCAGVGVLWVRSYLPNELFVLSRHGQLSIVFAEGSRTESLGAGQSQRVDPESALASMRAAARVDRKFAGIEFIAGPTSPPPRGALRGEYRVLSLAYAYLFLPAAAAAGSLVFLNRRSRQRQRLGLCPSCGYDLRASPDRCPECGAAASVSTGR